MSPLETLLWVLVMLAGLAGSAMFSGLETGIYSLSRVRLELAARAGDPAGHRGGPGLLLREMDRPESLLTTILVGNNTCNYLGTLGLGTLLIAGGLSPGAAVIVQTLVLTPVLVIFGESLPKELFRLRADTLPARLGAFIAAVRTVLTWTGVLGLLLLLVRIASRLAGVRPERAVSGPAERIAAMIRESASAGSLSGVQGALAEQALAFDRAAVRDVMVPWHDAATLPADATRADAMRTILRAGPTAYPLVERRAAEAHRGHAHRVLGVVVSTDLLADPALTPRAATTEPARIDPGTPARRALASLRSSGVSLAIVEEHGRPVGLVTAKDLVEPLTGRLAAW